MKFGEDCPRCGSTDTRHDSYGREGQEVRSCQNDDCDWLFYQVFAFDEDDEEGT